MKDELLRMDHIQCYRKGRLIIDNAHLNLFECETVGIVGINYSGKSTFIGAAAGFYPYARGTVYYKEEKVNFRTLLEAREAGIFYIQGTSSLIPEFSISENFFLMPHKENLLFQKESNKLQTKEILALLKIDENEDTPAGLLSDKNALLTEIGKALLHNAKIIILDNVLNRISESGLKEFAETFDLLRSLRISLILIESGLKYLKPYCDRLFIMREGKMVAELDQEEIEDELVVSLMIGTEFKSEEKPFELTSDPSKEVILSFHRIKNGNVLRGVNFQVFEGETAGILNVNRHSGAAIERLLQGTAGSYQGDIVYKGEPVRFDSRDKAIGHGIVAIPDEHCIFKDFTIEENITFMALRKHKKIGGRMDESELRFLAGELFYRYIKKDGDKFQLDWLVPDNRLIEKKAAFCRALAMRPDILIYRNPTQKMDVFSKKAIYDDLNSLRGGPVTVIVISHDIWELLQVCDRIIVINEGIVDKQISVRAENITYLKAKFRDQIKNI